MPLDPRDLAAIGGDLERLTDLIREARTQLGGSIAEEFLAERDEILLTYDGYLEPRLGAPDAPIVVAIVGPSGAGKSTLLNSIAGQRIAETGPRRPTTRVAGVWADAQRPYAEQDEFARRVTRHLGEEAQLVLTDHELTEHVTVIDTPPLESRAEPHIATQAVALADLCVFVTTPTRYADGRAWEFLRGTKRRGIPILFVLNRLPRLIEEQDAILADFALRLFQRELLVEPDPSLLFAIAEGERESATGGLPPDAVSAIRKELSEVADPVYRHGLVDETVYATARMVAERARLLTRPLAAEQPVIERLLVAVAHAYEVEARNLDTELRAGRLLPADGPTEWAAAAARVAGMVNRRSGTAAHVAAAAWSDWSEVAELIDREGLQLWRHGPGTANAARLALESWMSGLEALATTHAKSGRLRWRSGPRVVDALWRAVLRGDGQLPRRVRRKFADGGEQMVATARAELSEALRRGLAHDGERFTRFIGPEGDEELYSAIIDHADLVDARLDGLAVQIPSAWSEPAEDVEVVPQADTVLSIHIDEGSTVIELGPEEPQHLGVGDADFESAAAEQEQRQ